ncbi:hypothetical protein MTBBW1_10051 [Desulfamplus magnetovallimortis]|uniref:DUF3078 domain-containing protein n=1 Tax=Desulfamplus magnetovallimortis TaxID=1246637 RepID=A0A1W1H4M2_9BACT|nr:hypothetical protein [Desulfamplus magnetovallimortis]SLM27392.1 hypothetical protein MTBBW1_10051 [Desulfamplus magnetovallimortis]
MIKIIKIKMTIMAAASFFLFGISFVYASGLSFSASSLYPDNQDVSDNAFAYSMQDYSGSLSSNFASKGVYQNSSELHFSWLNFFALKMAESKDVFPWNTPTTIEEDRFDEVGGMQYELYDWEFQHVDYIRQDLVRSILPGIAEDFLKRTRTGRKLELLSRKISGYFTVKYMKTSDSGSRFFMPGHSDNSESSFYTNKDRSDIKNHINMSGYITGEDTEEESLNLYGSSLSVRLFNDVNSNPLEYALELNSFYLTTMTIFRYEPAEKRLTFTLTDSKLEKILDLQTAFEFVSEPVETYGIVKIFFDF